MNITVLEAPEMSRFNHDHSSTGRILSEHGMQYLKSRGIIIGRSGNWLYVTNEIYDTCHKLYS